MYGAKSTIRTNGFIKEDSRQQGMRHSNDAVTTLGVGTSGGGVASWQNQEGVPLLIEEVYLYISTGSTGASTIDVGTTAVSGATLSDNLIDGVSGATAGVFNNIDDKGTNGKSRQVLAPGAWVTASQASGAVAGLVGRLHVKFVRA